MTRLNASTIIELRLAARRSARRTQPLQPLYDTDQPRLSPAIIMIDPAVSSDCTSPTTQSSEPSTSALRCSDDDDPLIPTAASIERTYHDGKAIWSHFLHEASHMPQGLWPTELMDLYISTVRRLRSLGGSTQSCIPPYVRAPRESYCHYGPLL